MAAAPVKKKTRKHFFNLTLRGLPELEYFANPDERQSALDQLGSEAGDPKKGQFWLGALVVVAGALAGRYLAGWLLKFVSWPALVEELIFTAAMFGGFFLVLRWLHRSGAARELRVKLLATGVPICESCGYLLHGLPPSHERCPECGVPLGGRARELLDDRTIQKGAPPRDPQPKPAR